MMVVRPVLFRESYGLKIITTIRFDRIYICGLCKSIYTEFDLIGAAS